MADISRSREITAPPQAIWDVLADFGSLGSWVDVVDHSCVLNHGHDGGALGTTRRVQVGRNTLVERIVEFNEPSTLAYDIEGLPGILRHASNRWTLSPVGVRTVVTVTTTLRIGTNPVARAAERIILRVMAKQSTSMLAGLARHLGEPT